MVEEKTEEITTTAETVETTEAQTTAVPPAIEVANAMRELVATADDTITAAMKWISENIQHVPTESKVEALDLCVKSLGYHDARTAFSAKLKKYYGGA